jgi:hypothetical protein
LLEEVGALEQTLAKLDGEEAITNPDGLFPLDVLKYPVVRSSLMSRRCGGASMVILGTSKVGRIRAARRPWKGRKREKHKCRDQVVKELSIILSYSVVGGLLVGGWRLKMQPLLQSYERGAGCEASACRKGAPPLKTRSLRHRKHYDSEHTPMLHQIDRDRSRSTKRRWEHRRNPHLTLFAVALMLSKLACTGPHVLEPYSRPARLQRPLAPQIPAN